MILSSSWRSTCLLIAAAVLLGACERPQASAPADAVDLTVPGGGLGLLLRLDDKADPSALDRMQSLIASRLAAFGFSGVRLEAVGQRQLRLLVPGLDAAGARFLEAQLLHPAKVALAPVAPGKRFFEDLSGSLPKDGAVRVAQDSLGDLRTDKVAPVWYLASDDPVRLESLLADLRPPAGQRLAMMRGSGGAVAYLLTDPPPLTRLVFLDVRPQADAATGVVSVVARLGRPFLAPFAELVRGLRHRPLAILVNDELVALPVVASRMERGEIRIEPSPLADSEATRKQADRLAAMLQNLPLSSALHLERKVVTPPDSVR